MPRPISFRSFKIGCAILAALALAGFAALVVLWIIKPPFEWLGVNKVLFDDDLKGAFPEGSSRKFYFHDNTGMDWCRWKAFTAPPAAVEKYFESNFKVSLSEFKTLDGKQAFSSAGLSYILASPSRSNWRNRGYWDLDKSTSGLLYNSATDGYHFKIFYDPSRGRVFIEEGSM